MVTSLNYPWSVLGFSPSVDEWGCRCRTSLEGNDLFLLCCGSISKPLFWSRAHRAGCYAEKQQQGELCPSKLHRKQKIVVLNHSNSSQVKFSDRYFQYMLWNCIRFHFGTCLEVQPPGLSRKLFINAPDIHQSDNLHPEHYFCSLSSYNWGCQSFALRKLLF